MYEEFKVSFLEALAECRGVQIRACEAVGIAKHEFYYLKMRDMDFARDVDEVRARFGYMQGFVNPPACGRVMRARARFLEKMERAGGGYRTDAQLKRLFMEALLAANGVEWRACKLVGISTTKLFWMKKRDESFEEKVWDRKQWIWDHLR